ncbi:MAG: hypothetical protein L0229_14060 [Blastocatellia bacterium]|nr:hypothetical protein [Blastocatellia bacterium]
MSMNEERRKVLMKRKEREFFRGLLVTFLSLLITLIALLAAEGSILTVRTRESAGLYLLLLTGFALLLALMTYLVRVSKKESAEVTTLKYNLIHAFTDAIDKSRLNPDANSTQNKDD